MDVEWLGPRRHCWDVYHPPPDGALHSRFARGLKCGQMVISVTPLGAPDRGRGVVVNSGTRGVVVGQTKEGRVMVHFDGQRAPLRVGPLDVNLHFRWFAGQCVTAARQLQAGDDGVTVVHRRCAGKVVGLCPVDGTKLAVRFSVRGDDGSAQHKLLYVRPQTDVVDDTFRDERRQQVAEEEDHRRYLTRVFHAELDALKREELGKRNELAFDLELHLEHLLNELRDEGSAPQTRTGWTRLHCSVLSQAEKALKAASQEAVMKVIGRAERRVAQTGGTMEHRYFFALRLLTGVGTCHSRTDALHWLQAAADAGHPASRNLLGVWLLFGPREQRRRESALPAVSEQQRQEGLRLLQTAAAAGSTAAHYNLAKYTWIRRTCAEDEQVAVRHWRLAAERGHVPSQFRLAAYLRTASSSAAAREEGLQWMQQAAAAGHAKAQSALGVAMYCGEVVTGYHPYPRKCSTVFGLEDDGRAKRAEEGVVWLRRAANQGFAEAQFQLGTCLIAGCRYLTGASDDGDDDAAEVPALSGRDSDDECGRTQYDDANKEQWPAWEGLVADRLRVRTGSTPQEQSEGKQYLRRAAEQGHVGAMNSYGLVLLLGTGRRGEGSRSMLQGLQWLRRACDEEDSEASHNIGCCLFVGHGTDIDTRGALDLWRHAAILGSAEARKKVKSLARWLLVDQNNDSLYQRFEEGDPDALCDLSLRLLAEKGPADQALPHAGLSVDTDAPTAASDPLDITAFTAGTATKLGPENSYAAQAAFPGGILATVDGGVVGQVLDAQFKLALQLLFGLGLEADLSAAAQCLWRISDTSTVSHPGAQNALGVCFEHGIGVPRAPKMAVHWYRRAAMRGLHRAMINYGVCLYLGEGTRQNKREAVRWWYKAVEKGCDTAMFLVSLCQLAGEGCEFDKESGMELLSIAAESGIDSAINLQQSLHMDPRKSMEISLRKSLRGREALFGGPVTPPDDLSMTPHTVPVSGDAQGDQPPRTPDPADCSVVLSHGAGGAGDSARALTFDSTPATPALLEPTVVLPVNESADPVEAWEDRQKSFSMALSFVCMDGGSPPGQRICI
eukprot:TRINITY_DN28283_c0_g1_i2.p1 TRINITY_DN28283_c0_g1~~TRINITY_DN28283_c0_g1_i2.p1  ORF type:complete len:1066 (+),score=289.62 TRINITY_DN28283_c0_g1_i2:65-3262(+)